MNYSVIAKRYAKALFELGEEKSILDKIEKDLKIVHDTFSQDDQLNHFYNNPRVSMEQKKQLTKDLFKKLSKETLNTLLLLIDKKRISLVSEIFHSFVDMKNIANGIAEADVYSVRELNKKEMKQIQEMFQEMLNINTLRLNNIVDPAILGGIKLRIGNKIYDGTIQSQLKRLEQNLVSANK